MSERVSELVLYDCICSCILPITFCKANMFCHRTSLEMEMKMEIYISISIYFVCFVSFRFVSFVMFVCLYRSRMAERQQILVYISCAVPLASIVYQVFLYAYGYIQTYVCVLYPQIIYKTNI